MLNSWLPGAILTIWVNRTPARFRRCRTNTHFVWFLVLTFKDCRYLLVLAKFAYESDDQDAEMDEGEYLFLLMIPNFLTPFQLRTVGIAHIYINAIFEEVVDGHWVINCFNPSTSTIYEFVMTSIFFFFFLQTFHSASSLRRGGGGGGASLCLLSLSLSLSLSLQKCEPRGIPNAWASGLFRARATYPTGKVSSRVFWKTQIALQPQASGSSLSCAHSFNTFSHLLRLSLAGRNSRCLNIIRNLWWDISFPW